MLLGFSEGAACGTMLVACMQGAGKASCVELKEELSDVAWQQTWRLAVRSKNSGFNGKSDQTFGNFKCEDLDKRQRNGEKSWRILREILAKKGENTEQR